MNYELEENMNKLQKSPLFQLSLGSKELFHSNFLAWCCEIWRKEMGEVWTDLLIKPITGIKGNSGNYKAVRREYKNHDLEIDFEDKSMLLVELKVKSVPTEKQLGEYASEKFDTEIHFALISLSCPQFFTDEKYEVPGKATWRWIDLNCVARKINEKIQGQIHPDNHYFRELLLDYECFVSQLSQLITHIDISDNMGRNFFLPKEIDKKLRDARLHDLVYKYQYDQLRAKVGDVLKDSLPKEMAITVKAEMSNSTGLITVGYPILSPLVDIGIQLQGRQFRLYLSVQKAKDNPVVTEIVRAAIDAIENDKFWFDFNDDTVFEQKGNVKPQCSYNGVFRYKYREIKDIATIRLIELINKYLVQVHTNRDQIKGIIQKLDLDNILTAESN